MSPSPNKRKGLLPFPDDALQGRLREDRGGPQQTQSSRIKALLRCAACRGALGEYEENMLE